MTSIATRLNTPRKQWLVLALTAALSLSACGGGDEETAEAAPAPAPAPPGGSPNPPPPGTSNRAPTITGAPLASTLFGRPYSFIPSANDADGNPLTFSVSGLPSWATFSSTSGRLEGTPTQAHVGTDSNIVISVSDGTATTSLASFNIQVVATASGSAMLSWTPPTENSDGTPLNDLASYRVYFGTTSGNYPNTMAITNAGLASFVVDHLTPATWYFVVTAVNADGTESGYSNVATKTVL